VFEKAEQSKTAKTKQKQNKAKIEQSKTAKTKQNKAKKRQNTNDNEVCIWKNGIYV